MHPRIEEIVGHLQTNREVLRAAVDRVPIGNRELRPEAAAWSVAEVLEHLSLVEQRIARMISKLVEDAGPTEVPRETEIGPVINPRHMATLLDRSRRVETRDTGRPTGALTATDAWSALQRSRAQLMDVITRVDGLALSQLRHEHPLFGALDLYQWLAFLGGHEARHAGQIDEIRSSLAQQR